MHLNFFVRTFPLALGLFLATFASAGYSQSAEDWLSENITRLSKLYIQFHRNPELSFHEAETAKRFGAELEKTGATVTYGVGGHGVVAMLKNGPGPTVMLRSDLDGLPVTEQSGLPYASTKRVRDSKGKEVGTMHACGHDVHMTCLLGTAQFLAAHKSSWSGTLMLIGQPAEERGAGALAMINDGLFEKFAKPDYALAMHCNSTLPSGTIAIRGGYAMANVDSVDIEIYGRGGHGAYPHTTVDPIVVAAKLILDLQTVVSREIKPIEPAVLTVGSIHAGTKHNIIPDQCHLQLTLRSYSDDVRSQLIAAIKRKAEAAAASANAKTPLVTVSEGTPSLSNDEKLARQMAEEFRKQFGAAHVVEAEPVMGGEDFSHFGRNGIPSLMYFLGVVEPQRLQRYQKLGISPPSLHSAQFYPDIEKSVATGVQSLSAAAMQLLKN